MSRFRPCQESIAWAIERDRSEVVESHRIIMRKDENWSEGGFRCGKSPYLTNHKAYLRAAWKEANKIRRQRVSNREARKSAAGQAIQAILTRLSHAINTSMDRTQDRYFSLPTSQLWIVRIIIGGRGGGEILVQSHQTE